MPHPTVARECVILHLLCWMDREPKLTYNSKTICFLLDLVSWEDFRVTDSRLEESKSLLAIGNSTRNDGQINKLTN